jgi:hypothetical protein
MGNGVTTDSRERVEASQGTQLREAMGFQEYLGPQETRAPEDGQGLGGLGEFSSEARLIAGGIGGGCHQPAMDPYKGRNL